MGALFLLLAIESYTKTDHSMKQFQKEAFGESKTEIDEWVIADSLSEGNHERQEDFAYTADGGILLSEVSKEYVKGFLSGYQVADQGQVADQVQVFYEGELYYSTDFEGLIAKVEKNESYRIKVKSDFQYELITSSER